jgi:hypothetical protein
VAPIITGIIVHYYYYYCNLNNYHHNHNYILIVCSFLIQAFYSTICVFSLYLSSLFISFYNWFYFITQFVFFSYICPPFSLVSTIGFIFQ